MLWESSDSESSEEEYIDPKFWESLSSEEDNDEIDPKLWESFDSDDLDEVRKTISTVGLNMRMNQYLF